MPQAKEAYVDKPTFSLKNINFYFERDGTLRAHEVMVVFLDRGGNEREWFSFYVTDGGSIRQIGNPALVPNKEGDSGQAPQ